MLVHEAIYDRLLARLVEETTRITIGDGLEPGILLGSLVSKTQLDTVVAAIRKARRDGGRIACGGGPVAGRAKGYFVAPTVLVDVPLESDTWREEISDPWSARGALQARQSVPEIRYLLARILIFPPTQTPSSSPGRYGDDDIRLRRPSVTTNGADPIR